MDIETVLAAAAQCRRYNLTVDVANVAANVALRPGDYNKLIERGLRHEVRAAMKRAGFITANVETNVKVEAQDASLSDLEALLEIKERNQKRVVIQTTALRQLVEFLRVKRDELGYEPYVYLFEDDARRIYAMHGLELPSNWGSKT